MTRKQVDDPYVDFRSARKDCAMSQTRRRSTIAIIAFAAAILLVSMCYFYAAVSRSITAHFWLDEVLAVSTARLPSFGAIWSALWNGVEFSPPTYEFLLHTIMSAAHNDTSRLLPRLPSILAIFTSAICVYALVRPNLSRIGALVAFAVLLDSGLFDFAVQARQYALLTLGTALALLLWDKMYKTRHPIACAALLWLDLSICLSLHFYGVVNVAVIGIAELLWLLIHRQMRWKIWAALAATAITEAFWAPLYRHLATFNSTDSSASGFYAKPTFDRLADAIFELEIGSKAGALLLLAGFLLVGAGYLLRRSSLAFLVGEEFPDPPTEHRLGRLELIILALCTIPLISFAFSFFITKAFSPRYMSSVSLLSAIAAGYIVDKLPVRRFLATGLVLVISAQLVHRAKKADPTQEALLVVHTLPPTLPIVVGEGLLYIELLEAADQAVRDRLTYLLKAPNTISPDPTNENIVKRVASIYPDYRVKEQDRFLAETPSFYVVTRQMTTDTTTPSLIEKSLVGPPVTLAKGVLVFQAGRQIER